MFPNHCFTKYQIYWVIYDRFCAIIPLSHEKLDMDNNEIIILVIFYKIKSILKMHQGCTYHKQVETIIYFHFFSII